MKIELLMSRLFGFSPQTYFNWKKDENKRPIIKLLSMYTNKIELEEFLETGKIDKFEKLNLSDNYINGLFQRWLKPYDSLVFEKILYFYFDEFAVNFMKFDEEGELTDDSICYKYNNYNYGGVQPIELFISFVLDYQYNDDINNIILEYAEDDFINMKNYRTKLLYAVSNEITFEEFNFILEYKYKLDMKHY
ncbi:MAG: hypothetical protein PHS42_03700 [Sulfurimonas sp.]|nr:hypothetical protein [Sulfurimonas sp.]MDD3834557.1 hypothetical protein [Sulfurimonas sp.]